MNFVTVSALTVLSIFASSFSALTLLGICTRPGFIRFSHRHPFHWHRLPHFRRHEARRAVDADVVHDAENVFHLLKRLPNDCYTYQDDKYNYEYCHMESVRQTGLTVQNNLREEYNLGRYCPQRSFQKYSPLLHLAKISLVDGEPCGAEGDMHSRPRKTKVKFFCADPKMSMHIVKAYERKTCSYRVLVHVPELCFK